MARMDVTPQELRGSEIKEAFRGFNRDEVDDLLERAAATIENLTRRCRSSRAVPPATRRTLPTNRDDAEMLQRTLLLAQRAADDAVNEAQAHARKLIEESEARAQALVGEAESTARRIAEGERRRLEDEIAELGARRDQLAVDADALDEYVSGYRDRVRAAIEADLERLGRTTVEPPSPRPELHDVELPAERVDACASGPSLNAGRERAEPRPHRSRCRVRARRVERGAVSGGGTATERDRVAAARRTPSPAAAARRGRPRRRRKTAAGSGCGLLAVALRRRVARRTLDAEGLAPWDMPPPSTSRSPRRRRSRRMPLETGDDLDDDAFFASLREAVRDDAPLGPARSRARSSTTNRKSSERRGHFRRRR